MSKAFPAARILRAMLDADEVTNRAAWWREAQLQLPSSQYRLIQSGDGEDAAEKWLAATHQRVNEAASTHKPLAESLYALACRNSVLVKPLEDAHLPAWLLESMPAEAVSVVFVHDGRALRRRDGLRPWSLLPFSSAMLRLVVFSVVTNEVGQVYAEYRIVLQRDLQVLVVHVIDHGIPKLRSLTLDGMSLVSNDPDIKPLQATVATGFDESLERGFFLDTGSQQEVLRSLVRVLPLYIEKLAE